MLYKQIFIGLSDSDFEVALTLKLRDANGMSVACELVKMLMECGIPCACLFSPASSSIRKAEKDRS